MELSPEIYRILDANANRAREALRVTEDYARFALNDDGLSGELKQIRHDLAPVFAQFIHDAILHRNTPGDVGTTIKTDDEHEREDGEHVVLAAGKRLGEALRTIEEYLKIADPMSAALVELSRYEFYDVEQRLAVTLRPALFEDVSLYVLITESLCKRPWLEAAAAAIEGGADCIQLREKDMDGGELFRRACALVDLCRQHGVISIINDRADIAVASGADGVHVGQGDLPCQEARKIVGHGKIVGVSTHNIEQARAAQLAGADYIGVGPVFPSKTKPRDFLPGLDFAREAVGAVKIPCVAIAGITAENVGEVMATGVQAVAVSSAVISADDVAAAAKRLKSQFKPAKVDAM